STPVAHAPGSPGFQKNRVRNRPRRPTNRGDPFAREAPRMRLTLRTLLAYLDDTLEPNLAREIGQKVAESSVAQELIERIKKITPRPALPTPPASGSAKTDPNPVAEYPDTALSAEATTEVEETCLNDDTYLAEVAACHQILTLMLSEPAVVPPTARRRMYRLVKGRESIPYRRPPVNVGLADTIARAPPDTDKYGPHPVPAPPHRAPPPRPGPA